jgi:acyl-[acyl carrier protein]--UDP-N-acetylglucosamine O-acyltransferase
MKISDYTGEFKIIRDAEFNTLGYVDSNCEKVLAYVDTLKYLLKALANPNISCLITTPELAAKAKSFKGLVITQSPREVFYKIHSEMIKSVQYTLPFKQEIGVGCIIHPTAIICDGCKIGDNVMIGEHVVIQSPAWIGSNVTIDSGVKIGVDGILFTSTNDGPQIIKHAGYVRIKDGAILMTNSIVVRSIHDSDCTEVGEAALVGLGSIIGHEVKVGDRAIISNQCVLARRALIGSGAFLGTHVMIKEYTFVGEYARVMAGSVVIDHVPPRTEVSGNFATNHSNRMMAFTRLKRMFTADKKSSKVSRNSV